VAGRRPGTGARGSRRRGPAPAQLTLDDWERQSQLPARESDPSPRPPGDRETASADGVARLAEALAPKLAADLSSRLRPPAVEETTTTRLMTLDELVAQLPPAKRPQTWKRWLYERTRRGEVPGCVKLGGMLFFEPEAALAWLRAGAASTR
jgi:hypothetical protein